ncbi:MAG: methyl-accepting chemotaxis protein [Bacillus sp. (in: firmicutes)]
MALFITVVAIITYTSSAVFIYVLYPLFFSSFNQTGFTIVTLSAGVIWSSIIAFMAAGFIIKPLQKLERVALKAAHGDIGEDAEISKVDDEIRSLGIAFNHMLYNLRDMVLNIDENFKKTNEKVNIISAESTKAAEQADSISRTIREIALGADTSAVSIQNTAESVEEISYLARNVQGRAQSSEQISVEMVAELTKSKEVIRSLTSGIQKLANDNEDSLEAVQRLEGNAKKVEQIIQLVGDIAAQTNLLALNASIEAARAGEHGKGFAVVAEEVRLLADESANAVQGISTLIQNIQQDVQSVVTKISNQVKIANKEAEKGVETNAIIEEMTKTVHEVAAAVQEITKLVDQQMKSVENTSMLSQEVAAIAEETSAGAGEVSAATVEQTNVISNVESLASELQTQADQLKRTITRFKM